MHAHYKLAPMLLDLAALRPAAVEAIIMYSSLASAMVQVDLFKNVEVDPAQLPKLFLPLVYVRLLQG